MTNQTQKQWVIGRLVQNGRISRNECLSNFIARLGAIICQLKKEGYEFEEGVYLPTGAGHKDYIYKLKGKPLDLIFGPRSFKDMAIEKLNERIWEI